MAALAPELCTGIPRGRVVKLFVWACWLAVPVIILIIVIGVLMALF